MSRLKQAIERAGEDRRAGTGATAPVPPPPSGVEEPFGSVAEAAPDPAIVTEPPAAAPNLAQERVDPFYVRTRREETDPLILRRNKILAHYHQSGMADTVRMLRTQILAKLAESGGNSLLVTSTHPREGKTFTALNLAVSMSHEIHRTTLLVDTDLRNPSVHEIIGVERAAGLSDYLLGQAAIPDLLVNPGIPKLTILPGGTVVPNSTELLGFPRMLALVKELKERYADRFIIFDSTSLLTCADALVFSQHIDGVLMVVEAERTSREDFKRALELLAARPLLGFVYNKAKG